MKLSIEKLILAMMLFEGTLGKELLLLVQDKDLTLKELWLLNREEMMNEKIIAKDNNTYKVNEKFDEYVLFFRNYDYCIQLVSVGNTDDSVVLYQMKDSVLKISKNQTGECYLEILRTQLLVRDLVNEVIKNKGLDKCEMTNKTIQFRPYEWNAYMKRYPSIKNEKDSELGLEMKTLQEFFGKVYQEWLIRVSSKNKDVVSGLAISEKGIFWIERSKRRKFYAQTYSESLVREMDFIVNTYGQEVT